MRRPVEDISLLVGWGRLLRILPSSSTQAAVTFGFLIRELESVLRAGPRGVL